MLLYLFITFVPYILFLFFFFFFNDTATTEIYTLSYTTLFRSLYPVGAGTTFDMGYYLSRHIPMVRAKLGAACKRDRKSTRLNSSHTVISYAVFCLKKKKKKIKRNTFQ